MPPFSRGWTGQRFVRHINTSNIKPVYKKKTPKYKSSPIEGRAPPVPKSRKQPPPTIAPETYLPARSSLFARLLSRIPPVYRRTIGTTLIFTPFVLIAGLHCPFQPMWINGPSMEPMFNPNSNPDLPQTTDRILVQSLAFPTRRAAETEPGTVPGSDLRRGQIVVFRTPLDPNKIAVKRIVGIPGDRVQPLPGYGGGDGPVVVQYNHIWVEGDVDNREKSMDSNWYGPISQHLVLGKVVLLLEPWYRPKAIRIEEHKYPAKQKGRVEEDAVREASLDFDEVERSNSFKDGRVLRDLEMVRDNVNKTALLIQTNEAQRLKAVEYYKGANKEVQKNDPQSIDLARELLGVLEEALVKAGFDREDLRQAIGRSAEEKMAEIRKETQKEDPFVAVGSLPEFELPEQPERPVEEGPAARALREHLEKQRQERLEGVNNGLDDSERQQMWREQDRALRDGAERAKADAEKAR
jgi:signal peptidase I